MTLEIIDDVFNRLKRRVYISTQFSHSFMMEMHTCVYYTNNFYIRQGPIIAEQRMQALK